MSYNTVTIQVTNLINAARTDVWLASFMPDSRPYIKRAQGCLLLARLILEQNRLKNILYLKEVA